METIKINGETYEVDKSVADYLQYQEDTIKQLRQAHEKQEHDWLKAFELLKKRNELIPQSMLCCPVTAQCCICTLQM